MNFYETTVTCPINICGRQAFNLSREFSNFNGAWRISKSDNVHRADAKSLIGVLSLGIHAGDEIVIATSEEKNKLEKAKTLFQLHEYR